MNILSQLLALCLISTFLIGCGEKDPSRLKTGEELYSYYCMDCHKKENLGGYFENYPKKARPLKDYEIVLIIKYGYSNGHSMPVFSQLSDAQADTVARYAVSLREKYSPERQR